MLIAFPAITMHAQEPRVFTLEDFDLQGPVKHCLVITDYGKEEFEFNQEGILEKSVTRYGENSYDIHYYKYKDSLLLERRVERYQEGTFDPVTSMAHFDSYDSLPTQSIQEKILSYDKNFQEQYEFYYDELGRLIRTVHSHEGAVDETLLEYSEYKGEHTVSYKRNGILSKTVRTSTKKGRNGLETKLVLTKYFLEGAEERAVEEKYDATGKRISLKEFAFNPSDSAFAPVSYHEYTYDNRGMLLSENNLDIDRGSEKKRDYIYLYDGSDPGNWIKQIITPDNAYTTRRIKYYQKDITDE